MNIKGLCALSLCIVVAGSASAEKVPYQGSGDATPAGSCPTDGYKRFAGDGGMIPDCDPGGLTLSLATDDDGATIDDVILGVEISHTWVGDLRVWLSYDLECDGTDDVGPVAALCRPALDGCAEDGCCGCSDDLGGLYYFSDDAAGPLGEDCPGFLEAGCYAPAIDSPAPLSVFDGQPKGGCFTLFTADGACADTGLISSWEVAVLNGSGGTPVETTTWSALKARH
jgi:hypothetical protein